MKAREPDIQIQRWVAMLQAADLIEQERHYDFQVVFIPRSCDDVGCVLGWIGFAAGLDFSHSPEYDTPVNRVAHWLGYANQWNFYNQGMDPLEPTGKWYYDATLAAATLRKLAEEMTE